MSNKIPKIRTRFSLRVVEKRGTIVSQQNSKSQSKSLMAPNMTSDFVKMTGFPSTTFAYIPGPGQTVADCPEDFVVFFRYPFAETTIKFPFPPLVRSFFEVLGISPGQLMPSGWRILSVILELTKDWEDPFTLEDLAAGYEIKMAESGFVSLCKKGERLVLNTDVNDRGWKKWFFFVKRVSLGNDGLWLTEGWPTKELDLGFLESSEASSSKVKEFLAINPSARTFVRKKKAMGDQAGQEQSTPLSTPNQAEDSEETMSTQSAAQGTRRGRSLTQQEADLRMRRKRGLASREQQPAPVAEKVEPVLTPPLERTVDESGTITLSATPPRKQLKINDEPPSPDILMRFPANFLDRRKGDQHSLFPALNQLLFPKSREMLAGSSVLDIASEAASVHLYDVFGQVVYDRFGPVVVVVNVVDWFTSEQIEQLDKSKLWSRALNCSFYLPGLVGLNKLKEADFANVVIQALGELEVVKEIQSKGIREYGVAAADDGASEIETFTVPFIMLDLDLPPPPLFKDALAKNIIPQVPLFNILKKFDRETITEVVHPQLAKMQYRVTKLPPYVIMHIRRFTKSNNFVEKNPTIVNFPVKNLEMKDYIALKDAEKLRSKYDLMANIVHQGTPIQGSYKVCVQRKSEDQWYEVQDLHVSETKAEMVALSEAYVLMYELQSNL
uniref:USP domain-containing protein n=1 Tax=Chenopodium quinoa TaxID=63459 RepID=A0A803KX60_CHEQI